MQRRTNTIRGLWCEVADYKLQ